MQNFVESKIMSERERKVDVPIGATALFAMEQPNWTKAEFENMEKAVLKAFVIYNGTATMGEPWFSIVQERGFNEADRRIAMLVHMSATGKSVAGERPEAFINTHGGKLFCEPDKIIMQTLSGEKKVRVNSPIPVPFGTADRYPNIVQVAAFCGQLVKNDGGAWKKSINEIAFSKVFYNTALRVEGLSFIADKVVEMLTKDTVWKHLAQISRSAVTGSAAMVFIRQAIERLSVDAYDVLNTMIVCDGYRTFDKVGKEWCIIMEEDDQPVVPETVYAVKTTTKPVREMLKTRYPNCYEYRGQLLVQPNVPAPNGSIDSAKASLQQMREVLGKDDSVSNILSAMKDFSGLTDEFGKRIQFYLSAVLKCWVAGRKADIQLATVGDLPLLVSSLLFWGYDRQGAGKTQNVIGALDTSSVSSSTSSTASASPGTLSFASVDFKFLLPGIGSSVPRALKDRIIDNPRPDAVFIYWNDKVLPTSETKGERVNYDEKSFTEILPVKAHSGDYIVYGTLYGAAPFIGDKEVKQAMKNTLQDLVTVQWAKTPIVYQFGTSAYFKGIVTSLSEFCLIGYGVPKDHLGNWDVRMAPQLIAVDLRKVERQKDWYNFVSKSAAIHMVGWLCPRSRYSPISNLVQMTKNYVTLVRGIVEDEGGKLYQGTVSLPTRKAVKRLVRTWDEEKKFSQDEEAESAPDNYDSQYDHLTNDEIAKMIAEQDGDSLPEQDVSTKKEKKEKVEKALDKADL